MSKVKLLITMSFVFFLISNTAFCLSEVKSDKVETVKTSEKAQETNILLSKPFWITGGVCLASALLFWARSCFNKKLPQNVVISNPTDFQLIHHIDLKKVDAKLPTATDTGSATTTVAPNVIITPATNAAVIATAPAAKTLTSTSAITTTTPTAANVAITNAPVQEKATSSSSSTTNNQ